MTGGRPETADSDRAGLFLNTVPFRRPCAGKLARQAVFAAEQEIQPYQRYPLAEIRRLHRRAAVRTAAMFSRRFSTLCIFMNWAGCGLTGFDLLEEQFVGSANFRVDFELLPQGPCIC
ncbi:MAG: hypothetical protein R3E31_16640 [Chloroflexota bacterium]